MMNKFFAIFLCISLCFTVYFTGCSGNSFLINDKKCTFQSDNICPNPASKAQYGVFLGINQQEAYKLDDYKLVVIDPSQFQAEAVEKLHKKGKIVYGYLNIGAIENYRPYYEDFQNLTLGVYENWTDEMWIDTTSAQWQNHIVKVLANKYADMGIDGFFLDNADVYYHYPADDIFQGLVRILKGLKAYNLPLIINGGDSFVSKTIEDGTAKELFDGINQETVFTSIDFKHKSYGKQTKSETLYFQEYLSRAKAAGLSVYLLEYGADLSLANEIDEYCRENGFQWYNAEGLELQ